jgi:hypothetical protein
MLKMLHKQRIQQMQQIHGPNVFQHKESTNVEAPLNKIKTETDNRYWGGEGADMYPEEDSGGFDETCNLPNNIPGEQYISRQKDKSNSEIPQRTECCICRLQNSIVNILQMLFKWRK